MAALAGIGSMPDTITDRAVNITMRRRAADETVSTFRSRRDGPGLERLRMRLAAWAAHNIDTLSASEPDMPVEDRAADTWEPLVAVADVAGGHWPTTARSACKALVDHAADADEDQSLGVKLLADIKQVFTDRGVPFLPSMDLVNELRRIEESPWNDFDLNARKLALRLKDFGIKPGRNTIGNVRGYTLDAFWDALGRYLRPEPSEASETTDEQAKPSDGSNASDASIRQSETTVRTETAGQQAYLTDLTGPDAPPAETVRGAPTDNTPGQTDRVADALARARAKETNRGHTHDEDE
jgi:hypothetical protein